MDTQSKATAELLSGLYKNMKMGADSIVNISSKVQEGALRDELTKELQTYVKQNTAPYKYPRVIEYVDALPKTFNGKIRRVEIRNNDKQKYEENNK